MAYKYARGSNFDSEKLWTETELTEVLDSFTASSQYYYNQTTISSLTIQDGSFVTNDGTILSGNVKDTGTLYVTGGNVFDVVVQDGGWLGITIDAGHVDEINISVSAASATGSESIEFSYQNAKQVSDLTIPGFCGLAIEGEPDGFFTVSNISVKGHLELDEVQAENISVLRQGGLLVHSGTAINDLTISVGGNVYIKNDVMDRVVFSGKLRLGGTLHLHHYNKTVPDSVITVTGTLIFDLTERSTADDFMVDDLDSVICDSYEICVPGKKGVYKLADGAYNFDRTITVYSGDTSIGRLKAGQTLKSGNNIYSLNNYDGALTLTVNDYSSIRQLNGNVGNIHVKNGETAYLNPGSKANNIQIDRGGVVIVPANHAHKDPKVTGTITVAGQLVCDIGEGEGDISDEYKFRVVFDISAGAIPKSPMIVNIEGVSTYDFNICVSADQKTGTYILADGWKKWPLKNFYFGIGTKNKYGNKISPTKSYLNAKNKYAISVKNNNVYLKVSRNEGPAAPTAKASITKLTNKNITIKATFSKDSAKKQYSTNGKSWKTYSGAITVKGNGSYYFRGIDKVGAASKVTTIKITNIDKTAPVAPKLKASTTAATNKNVTITASFAADSAKKQYSLNNKSWNSCSGTVSFGKNGTYYFRSVDAAGNVSKVTSIKVTNIDKTAPTAPKLKVSSTKLTNQNITITATFSKDSAVKQYSTDNKTWKNCSNNVSVGQNGTYYFRGIDKAGNASKVTSIKVTNIDKTAPVAPTVTASTTAPTNQPVTVTASFSADSAKKQYSTDNKTWNTYTKALTTGSNTTYYFRALDKVGNVSEVTSKVVDNIMDTGNNDWDTATAFTGEVFAAVSSPFDAADCYDIDAIVSLEIYLERGQVTATFCKADGTPVECTMHDGVGGEICDTSFEIARSDDPDQNARYFDAIADEVKYLKIETAAGGVNSYRLAKLA